MKWQSNNYKRKTRGYVQLVRPIERTSERSWSPGLVHRTKILGDYGAIRMLNEEDWNVVRLRGHQRDHMAGPFETLDGAKVSLMILLAA